jgi:hypothetical protein
MSHDAPYHLEKDRTRRLAAARAARAPATATPELSRFFVDGALDAAFEAIARARGVLFGAYRGSFPATSRVEFLDRTVRRFRVFRRAR